MCIIAWCDMATKDSISKVLDPVSDFETSQYEVYYGLSTLQSLLHTLHSTNANLVTSTDVFNDVFTGLFVLKSIIYLTKYILIKQGGFN